MEVYIQGVNEFSGAGRELPFVLSIAGMDPSAGAGLLADIKTFQHHGVYGLGVISCNTVQTDKALYQLDWVPRAVILAALQKLCARYAIRAVKIGVMQDLSMLQAVVRQIRSVRPAAKIVWDPVVKASSGERFFRLDGDDLTGKNASSWAAVLRDCHVVTPNGREAVVLAQLLGLKVPRVAALSASLLDPVMRQVSRHTAVVLKGGHLTGRPVMDRLYQWYEKREEAEVYTAGGADQPDATTEMRFEKHGSGCVHSSLLAAMLARAMPLREAVCGAKSYMDRFLASTPGKLGLHLPESGRTL